MAIRDYVRQRPPIAAIYQADDYTPDPEVVRSAHVATMDAWGVADDIPVLISEDNGVFVPATATETGIIDYDPWIWAQPARILDWSRPTEGPYGEVGTPGKAASIVAEWGGMAAPVRSFQDISHIVLYSQRQVNYHSGASGPTGTFYGPQQTAWEATTQTPTSDYWSTIILGGP